MNLATKTLLMLAAVTTATMAQTENEKLVLEFSKQQLENNNINYSNLKSTGTKKIKGDWEVIKIEFDVKDKDKKVHAKEQIIINEGYIVSDAINVSTMQTIKEMIAPAAPEFPVNSYDDSKLILGNKNAKTKVAIFSDPFCPFCRETIDDVQKIKSNDVAVYLYHLPLQQIHPAARSTIKNIIASKDLKKIVFKVYDKKVQKEIMTSSNPKDINNWFNKITDKNVSLEAINTEEVNNELEKDISLANQLQVSGTPTIFINGKIDKTHTKFKNLLN